jgi:hypothetical protein
MSGGNVDKADQVSIIMTRLGVKALCLRAGRDRRLPTGIRGHIVSAALVVLAALAIGPVGVAWAEPVLSITSPANGSAINDQTPSFSGTTTDQVSEEGDFEFNPVMVSIYAGASPTGAPVQPVLQTPFFLGGFWTVGPIAPLPPGTYTAQAVQSEQEAHNGVFPTGRTAVTFTIDTMPPQVILTSPPNGSSTTKNSQVVSGSAGTSAGDLPGVTVQLFAGSTIGSQAPVEALTVQASGGSWTGTFGGLSPGTYTARAEQSDQAGNVGTSSPVTFTVTVPAQPPSHTPPAASFKWFPSIPKIGEQVSLVSSSTDLFSPITSFAWALTSNGPFSGGRSSLTTSFATAGEHVVRLRVTASDGLSNTATQTIHVSRQPLTLMQPFPIVRIAGIVTSSGVNLSLLTAQAPVGARVKVTCRGRGCPTASESRVASSSSRKHRPSMVLIAFRRFQRSLGAGAILEVRISKPGRIGKYTRFSIRRGKLPVRLDSCIGPAGIKPIACPSS